MHTRFHLSTIKLLIILATIVVLITPPILYALRVQTPGYPLPPSGKPYFGIQLDSEHDSVAGYAERFGATPALYGQYVSFPMTSSEYYNADYIVNQLAERHSALMLTLEPNQGLNAITTQNLTDLTSTLTKWNNKGVPVIVRFAHEMNGSWYPWAQSPKQYVKSFRQVSIAVHKSPKSSIIWSPNEAGQYPYHGGQYEAKPGTEAFSILDTNHDGVLNMNDDPYGPYYPGDSAVDWVGLTIYHYGTEYPWGENELPAPHKLEDKINGTYNYAGVDESAIPNFYQTYAAGHNKPFAISETAAFYNRSNPTGASEYAIKSAWWQQLLSTDFPAHYPNLKLVVWFEYQKQERDSGQSIIDWRTTADPTMAGDFRAFIGDHYSLAPLH